MLIYVLNIHIHARSCYQCKNKTRVVLLKLALYYFDHIFVTHFVEIKANNISVKDLSEPFLFRSKNIERVKTVLCFKSNVGRREVFFII